MTHRCHDLKVPNSPPPLPVCVRRLWVALADCGLLLVHAGALSLLSLSRPARTTLHTLMTVTVVFSRMKRGR